MSKLALRVVGLGIVIAVLGIGSYAIAGSNTKHFDGFLTGFEENPDVSTPANGTFEAELSPDGTTLTYRLSYADIDGGNVTQAHIHFAKRGVNGGIVLWLCSNGAPNTPAGTQACPLKSGTVTGTLDKDDVQAIVSQGIPAGQAGFDEIVGFLRAGRGYANVHSQSSPGGEIRAQLNDNRGRGRGSDDD